MSRTLLIFFYLSVSIGIEKASASASATEKEKEKIQMACPDPLALGYLWKKGGRDMVRSTLQDQRKLNLADDIYNFPDVTFQVNPYIDSNGDLICQYLPGSSEPFIRLNMGKQKLEKVEKPKQQQ